MALLSNSWEARAVAERLGFSVIESVSIPSETDREEAVAQQAEEIRCNLLNVMLPAVDCAIVHLLPSCGLWEQEASLTAITTAIRLLDRVAASLESVPNLQLVLLCSRGNSSINATSTLVYPTDCVNSSSHGKRRRYSPLSSAFAGDSVLIPSDGYGNFLRFLTT